MRKGRRKRYRLLRGGVSAALGCFAVAGLVFLLFGPHPGFNLGGFFSTVEEDSAVAVSPAAEESLQQLSALPVREGFSTVDVPEYKRDAFGQRWFDADGNGCDTRNDILARDLARPTFKEDTHNCVVTSGTLAEPYAGITVEFRRGEKTSELVQIDHVVALADAWRSGAWEWTPSQRQDFANDPMNLLAVDGKLNNDKGAQSADSWLPPNKDFHCDYAQRQIAVKFEWGLSVTVQERTALAEIVKACP